MAIQNIRTWQWMLIGLLVGGVVALAWNLSSSDGEAASSWSLRQFALRLNETNDAGNPVLTNIVIDPMLTDNAGNQVQRVRFTLTARNRNTGKWDPYEDASVVTTIPLISDRPDYRIQDYIAEQQKQNPKIVYKYAWWKLSSIAGDRELHFWQKAKNSWFAMMGLGLLVIGIIWPAVIKTLIKMGLVPQPDERTDLSKVKNVKSKPMEKKGPKVTSADLHSLDDLNAKLEASVGDMLIHADEHDEAAERKKEAAIIKKLSNVPLEQQNIANPNDDPKEYMGEYYPVVKPHHHEEDDKKK